MDADRPSRIHPKALPRERNRIHRRQSCFEISGGGRHAGFNPIFDTHLNAAGSRIVGESLASAFASTMLE